MTRKGKRKSTFVGSAYWGYAHEGAEAQERGIRQHRRRQQAHFSFSHMGDVSMTGSNKRQKGNQEAHMMPGIDGDRIFGFPNSIITKLRYVDFIELTSTTGSLATNVFNANSVYDPDQTGTGHQPLYRDQFAAIYDQYTVLGAKITARFQPYQIDQAWIVGIVADDDSSITSTATTRCEQNNSVWTTTGSSNTGPYTLSATYAPVRDIGVDVKDDGFSATAVGANPTELFCFAVWVQEQNVALTGKCQVAVEIEYTVKFSELVTPTTS